MTTEIRWRRGTAIQHTSFTGALGEVTIDTTNKRLVVHDGAAAGGFPVPTLTAGALPVNQGGTSATDAAGARTALGVGLANNVAPDTVAAAVKATPVDADVLPLVDSAAANALKKLSWASIKAALLTYFAGVFVKPGSSHSFRNRKINGNFSASQEYGASSVAVAAGLGLGYIVDQYFAYCTGGSVTTQQVTLANNTNRLRVTGAAGNLTVGIGQRMPVLHTADMAGGPATLSVKLSSSSLTVVNWEAFYANTADTFGTIASPTKTSIASGSFTGVSATEAVYSAQVALPAAAKTGIEIVYTTGPLTAGNTLTIGEDQFEPQAIAPADIVFERVDAITNLARVTYFFGASTISARAPATAAGQVIDAPVAYSTMRTTPMFTLVGGTGATGNITAEAVVGANKTSARFSISSLAAGDTYAVDRLYHRNARL